MIPDFGKLVEVLLRISAFGLCALLCGIILALFSLFAEIPLVYAVPSMLIAGAAGQWLLLLRLNS